MKISGLFPFLYSWTDTVLNTNLGYNIPIVQSHQNGPQPSGSFIAIGYTPVRLERKTHGINGEIDPTSGEYQTILEYDGYVEIWEVNSDGSRLADLINSLEQAEVYQLWVDNKVAFWDPGTITAVPRTKNNDWEQESVVEMRVAFADSVISTPGYISQTNLTGTIPGAGQPGEHIITENIGETP